MCYCGRYHCPGDCSPPPRTRRAGSYKDAIAWIAYNDDTLWLDDEENGSPSVTLCLVADVFGRTIEEAEADLRKAMKRKAKEN